MAYPTNPSSIHPDNFKTYHPRGGRTFTVSQAKRLAAFTRQQSDEAVFLYLLRFLFGIKPAIIERYTGMENVNGIVEAFRYACKRHLDLEHEISDAGMVKALHLVMHGYEIMLLSSTKGICWLSGKSFDYSFTVREAVAVMEQRRIRELENFPISVQGGKLNNWQVGKLRRCILTLPFRDGKALSDYFLHGKNEGIPNGQIAYLRETLTKKMKLRHLIGDESLRQALERL
jgi:hypothetical protein